MINLGIPYTYENSSNPWLMDKKDDKDVIEINGNKVTAKYMWSLNCKERIQLLNDVFNYYRKNGFPYLELSNEEIKKEFEKLCKYDEQKVINNDGFISNSGNLCIDLCKYFSKDFFYKAKGGIKSLSVEDVFYDDELFIKVLKNRMGWNTSKEDGVERPYLFPISNKMILNGIRNSGLGYGVSNFRPNIAKWMYNEAINMLNYNCLMYNVFDYSAGWGARALGALSLGNINYYGTDPLTYTCIKQIKNTLNYNNVEFNMYNKCSEDLFFRTNEFKNKFDIIGSCPPYFDLEIYADDIKQSITDKDYQAWLKDYWSGTIDNLYWMIKQQGILILVIKENHGKYELKKDMESIILNKGFIKVKEYQYKSNTNHLSAKVKTGRTSKTNEYICFYEKI